MLHRFSQGSYLLLEEMVVYLGNLTGWMKTLSLSLNFVAGIIRRASNPLNPLFIFKFKLQIVTNTIIDVLPCCAIDYRTTNHR